MASIQQNSLPEKDGRKRGQSGQGSELGSIPQRQTTPKPESMLRKGENVQPSPKEVKVENKAQTTPQAHKTADETPKAKRVTEPQAAAEEQAEAGAETQEVEEGMKDVSLEDPAQGGATPKAKKDEGLAALKPKNNQAPEVKG